MSVPCDCVLGCGVLGHLNCGHAMPLPHLTALGSLSHFTLLNQEGHCRFLKIFPLIIYFLLAFAQLSGNCCSLVSLHIYINSQFQLEIFTASTLSYHKYVRLSLSTNKMLILTQVLNWNIRSTHQILIFRSKWCYVSCYSTVSSMGNCLFTQPRLRVLTHWPAPTYIGPGV